MTTQDPRYKHKPSEKHTLEEVLKSLQDLIRNDLPGDKSAADSPALTPANTDRGREAAQGQSRPKPPPEHAAPVREDFAPVNPAAGPVNLNAVMRSLKDLIGNELNVGDQPPPEDDLTPPLPEEDILASAVEALAPLNEEPTFEEADEPIPGDGLAPSEEDLAPPLPEDDFLESPADEPTPLQAEPTFEESRAPGPGDEPMSPEGTTPLEQPAVEEPIADQLAPLDEELTFEESVEAAPAPPDTPELPGEISPKLLAEPVTATPPEAPQAAGQIKIAPGVQQELLFDEPAPLIIDRQLPSRETGQKSQMKPEPALEHPAPESFGESAAQNPAAPAEGALPTIEVEETFDDSAYFDVEAPLATSPSEEIVAPVVEPPVTPAATATEKSDDAGEMPKPRPDDVPQPEAPPPKTELKLEIVDEPDREIPPGPASVDFDGIDLTSPTAAPGPASVPAETGPAANEPPQTGHGVQSMPSIDFKTVDLDLDKETPARAAPSAAPFSAAANEAAETPTAPESTPEVAMTKKTAPDENKNAAAAEPEPGKASDDQAARPASSGKKRAKAAPPEAKLPTATTFNLEDIPVLHEVVAPPAGGILAPPPAPLPAPDRARDIVVRAVAKLNVELRKSGGAGLDTKTILRLQKLIRQELEKDGEK